MHGHILLERTLPLSWTVLETAAQVSSPENNHIVFNLLDTLEEPALHKSDAENATDLLRIEAKLNVVMQLLGQMLQSRQPTLPAVTLRFTSDSLAWQIEQALPVGSLIQVSLYPENSIPLAISFVARVLGVTERWMEVDMHGLSEEEQTIWSRWVFRQHRRQVAQARAFTPGQVQPK